MIESFRRVGTTVAMHRRGNWCNSRRISSFRIHWGWLVGYKAISIMDELEHDFSTSRGAEEPLELFSRNLSHFNHATLESLVACLVQELLKRISWRDKSCFSLPVNYRVKIPPYLRITNFSDKSLNTMRLLFPRRSWKLGAFSFSARCFSLTQPLTTPFTTFHWHCPFVMFIVPVFYIFFNLTRRRNVKYW